MIKYINKRINNNFRLPLYRCILDQSKVTFIWLFKMVSRFAFLLKMILWISFLENSFSKWIIPQAWPFFNAFSATEKSFNSIYLNVVDSDNFVLVYSLHLFCEVKFSSSLTIAIFKDFGSRPIVRQNKIIAIEGMPNNRTRNLKTNIPNKYFKKGSFNIFDFFEQNW